MQNVATLSDRAFDRFVRPMDYVTNGTEIGRYFGTTARGTRVVAWGDKRDDPQTAAKLIAYVERYAIKKV